MHSTTSIGHRPTAKWKFDRNVTACFDDMLRRSIPQHDSMRDLVHSIALEEIKHQPEPVLARSLALLEISHPHPRGRGLGGRHALA